MRFIRWKALLPLSVTLALMFVLTVLFKNRVVEWGVEAAGTAAVGARVDLGSASLSLTNGNVTLNGLEVTNPNSPMRNMVEAEQLIFDLGMLPLLEKKIVIDTVAARGIRFNTPRQTSGAIPQKPKEVEETSQVIADFKSRIKVPPLELSTLTQSVNVDAISADSLATLRAARYAVAFADTARDKMLADLRAADPRPAIDSAEALVRRLQATNLRTLGIPGARQAVTDVRRTIRNLEQIDDRLKAFEVETRGSAAGLQAKVDAIGAARATDLAYARSLLRLPTFEIPSVGPQLFSDLIAEQLGDVLYWGERIQQYIPPGLERQMQPGPKRVRASGTDVLFPKEAVYPTFLLRLAELSLAIAGDGAAAGDYRAQLVGVTTQPAVYGAPTTFLLQRTGGTVGPREGRVTGMFDHRRVPVRDTLGAYFSGIKLPDFPIGGLGGAVQLGQGMTNLRISRQGEQLSGEWTWRAPRVSWVRDSVRPVAADARARFVEDMVWNAMRRIDSVEIVASFGGTIKDPTLAVKTNVATAVGNALREQLGEEVRKAEAQVRAKVNSLVDAEVAKARTKADEVKAQATQRVVEERAKLEAQKQALEARLRELTRIPGIG
jgi:uncharacterized protein (TIGR03545 family)